MTTTEIQTALLTLPMVDSASIWEKSESLVRVYLNLVGYDVTFRGCKTTKAYYDCVANKLVITEGRGTQTDAFRDSVSDLEEVDFDALFSA